MMASHLYQIIERTQLDLIYQQTNIHACSYDICFGEIARTRRTLSNYLLVIHSLYARRDDIVFCFFLHSISFISPTSQSFSQNCFDLFFLARL
mmetsp:Transcript_31698/g.66664  ORF Transcript_31698/g.66664 Transcript_31698/m.66664 type:complete len:93 (+) Transcript_31698:335-613(+)